MGDHFPTELNIDVTRGRIHRVIERAAACVRTSRVVRTARLAASTVDDFCQSMPKTEKKSDENLTKICTICFLEKTVSPANSHFSCVEHCISFQSKFSIFVTDFFEKKHGCASYACSFARLCV